MELNVCRILFIHLGNKYIFMEHSISQKENLKPFQNTKFSVENNQTRLFTVVRNKIDVHTTCVYAFSSPFSWKSKFIEVNHVQEDLFVSIPFFFVYLHLERNVEHSCSLVNISKRTKNIVSFFYYYKQRTFCCVNKQ